MQSCHWKAALLALCFIATPTAFAADPGADEYQKRLKVYQTIQPLGQSPFGEQINLYTGETTFVQTDVSFPGTGLPIEVTRALGKQDELGQVATPPGFGDWELQLPYIETLTAGREIGWQTTTSAGAPTLARCSTNFTAMFNPPERHAGQPRYGGFELDHWWRGYQLHVPGAGKQEILGRAAGDTRKPDHGVHPGTTYRFWQVGCLPNTSNGHAGEAFVVVSPDGTRYFMDHLVHGPYRTLRQTLDASDKPIVFSLERTIARMYATRVVDRFGNWLSYKWEGERVIEIRASDAPGQPDRVVALDWVGDRIHAVRMQAGSAQQRTWSYAYAGDGSLSAVALPDGSSWFFVGTPIAQANTPVVSNLGCHHQNPAPGAGVPTSQGEPRTFTLAHPSGLVGAFRFEWRMHAQTAVPGTCEGIGEVVESRLPYFYTLGIVSKTLSGPGVDASTWRYEYEQNHASFDRFCEPQATCQHTAYVDVIDPEQRVTRYTHSTRFDALEGQLLRIDHGLAHGVAARSELIEYHTPWGTRPAVFPYGASMGGGNWYKVGDTTPIRKRTILQQGRAFTWEVPGNCQSNGERGSGTTACFDGYLRPTRTVKASEPAP